MTREARAALLALYHCGVVSASWTHPGYRELRTRRLVSFRARPGESLFEHRLTARGRDFARALFE